MTPRTRGEYMQPFWSSTAAVVGTGNVCASSPVFTYTKAFCSLPSVTMMSSLNTVEGWSLAQFGSADMRIGLRSGAGPSKRTTPESEKVGPDGAGAAAGAG